MNSHGSDLPADDDRATGLAGWAKISPEDRQAFIDALHGSGSPSDPTPSPQAAVTAMSWLRSLRRPRHLAQRPAREQHQPTADQRE